MEVKDVDFQKLVKEIVEDKREIKRQEKLDNTFYSIAVCILMPIVLIIAAYVIMFLWNTFVAATFDIKSITLVQAMGIDLLVSFLVSNGDRKEMTNKESAEKLIDILGRQFTVL